MNDTFQCTFHEIDTNIFECQFCGQTVESVFPANQIHARCCKQEKKVTTEQRLERKAICVACDKYNGKTKSRCSVMDLGCIHTYMRFLRSAERSCPLGKWPLIALDGSGLGRV